MKTNKKAAVVQPTLQVEQGRSFTPQLDHELLDGTALVFSDQHYLPSEEPSTAHRAVVLLARELRPDLLIDNGDAVDLACISKRPRRSWEHRATVRDEIAVMKKRLAEIEQAQPDAYTTSRAIIAKGSQILLSTRP
jgi:hypothetical protein